MMMDFEQLAEQYDIAYNLNLMILEKCNTIPTKWELPNKDEFILITLSTKKKNHQQLTLFRSDVPQYDLQRTTKTELAHELTLLDAKIHTINYLL